MTQWHKGDTWILVLLIAVVMIVNMEALTK